MIIFRPFIAILCACCWVHAAPPAKVEAGSEEHLRNAAATIDSHLAELFTKRKLATPAQTTDAQFLRRTSLVVAGRIPTLEETRAFLEASSSDKRARLVSYYLHGPGYQSAMSNWLFDLLRVKENFERRGSSAAPYINYLREAIAYQKPWDELVNELLTAEGSIWHNGAVGYYIRDKGMPLDNLANTMRVFTGTRMECAQCHDHPFEDWERKDYYQLAAFTSKQAEINGQSYRSLYQSLRAAKQERSPAYKLLDQLGANVYYSSLSGKGAGRIALPSDYQYRDGDPGEYVGARTLFGKTVRLSARRDADDGKKRFAHWLSSPTNPRFTSVIVNRMWKRIMGTGLYEPVDGFVTAEQTASPALSNYLSRLMIELNYDLQKFQHVLLLTRAYGFAPSPSQRNPDLPYHFHGRQLDRLSAEQIWDSLVTLASGSPEQQAKRKYSNTIYLNGKPVLEGKLDMGQLSQQLLSQDSEKNLKRYLDGLLAHIADDKAPPGKMMGKRSRPGPAKGYSRASELPSPAPAGHFLRDFGQSDRVLIGTASREPNISQVLNLLNGHVEKMITSNPKAAIHSKTANAGSTANQIRLLFLSILSRQPSTMELNIMEEEIRHSGPKGYNNIIAALLSSREFLFIQ